jgi:DNA-binding SARP family transcriptional activator
LVRKFLLPDQTDVAAILDMLIGEYENHLSYVQDQKKAYEHIVGLQHAINSSNTSIESLAAILAVKSHTIINNAVEEKQTKNLENEKEAQGPVLHAVCLAPFELRLHGTSIPLGSNRNGQAILRYLVAQPNHQASNDTLMDLFWPDDDNDVALHKLHVTISNLRHSLQAHLHKNYILSKQSIFQLNPVIPLTTDVDEFLTLYSMGQKLEGKAAIFCYERACALYTRPFLIEDLYEDWSFVRREQLRQIMIEMCNALADYHLKNSAHDAAVQWVMKILGENRYDEAAYRQLMRIYALSGKRNEALHQYQRCQQMLQEDLGLQLMPETVYLHESIIRGELSS